ncbi:hypothetical protein OROHE_003321 [Orobanche hederae]
MLGHPDHRLDLGPFGEIVNCDDGMLHPSAPFGQRTDQVNPPFCERPGTVDRHEATQ